MFRTHARYMAGRLELNAPSVPPPKAAEDGRNTGKDLVMPKAGKVVTMDSGDEIDITLEAREVKDDNLNAWLGKNYPRWEKVTTTYVCSRAWLERVDKAWEAYYKVMQKKIPIP
jgi:hypothetical protein